jgi:hypothetical protein
MKLPVLHSTDMSTFGAAFSQCPSFSETLPMQTMLLQGIFVGASAYMCLANGSCI